MTAELQQRAEQRRTAAQSRAREHDDAIQDLLDDVRAAPASAEGEG